jgi:hypothetical protein
MFYSAYGFIDFSMHNSDDAMKMHLQIRLDAYYRITLRKK